MSRLFRSVSSRSLRYRVRHARYRGRHVKQGR
jgi:hypothetical protein